MSAGLRRIVAADVRIANSRETPGVAGVAPIRLPLEVQRTRPIVRQPICNLYYAVHNSACLGRISRGWRRDLDQPRFSTRSTYSPRDAHQPAVN